MARWIFALMAVAVLAACANAPQSVSSSGPAAPTVARIVCEADGSTTILTPRVLVQRDGVHVRVLSHLDEPASINGWGSDVDPGNSTWTFGGAPSVVRTACWRFSDHDTLVEPATQPIEVLDPEGFFVVGDLECDGQSIGLVSDYFQEPDRAGPVPLDIARRKIRGLEAADEVRYTGYPQEADPAVIVIRAGQVIGSFSFARFDGQWDIPGGSYCDGVGIRA
jgi:hypothetical protein